MESLKDSAAIWQPGQTRPIVGGTSAEIARVQLPDGCSDSWIMYATATITNVPDTGVYIPYVTLEIGTNNGKVIKTIDCCVRAEEAFAGQYASAVASLKKLDGTDAPDTVKANFTVSIARGTRSEFPQQVIWLPDTPIANAVRGNFLTNRNSLGVPSTGPCKLRRIMWTPTTIDGNRALMLFDNVDILNVNAGDRPRYMLATNNINTQKDDFPDLISFYRGCVWAISTDFDVLALAATTAKVNAQFLQNRF